MNRSVKFWVRGTALPLALLLGLSLVAPASDAEELQPAAAPAPLAPNPQPLATAASVKLAALTPAAAALATTTQAADPNATDGKSFFKSTKGVLALVLAVAGVSYVIYSSHHDRLHSGVR